MEYVLVPAVILVVVGGMILRFRWERNRSSDKLGELKRHLQNLGIQTYLLAERSGQPPVERRGLWSDVWSYMTRSADTLGIKERDLDCVFVVYGVSKQGTHYWLDYIVKATHWPPAKSLKTTRMRKKRRFLFLGRATDIEWKGDDSLAAILQGDYKLKERLLKSRYVGQVMRWISIYPQAKYGYYKIRTSYYLPDTEFFEALDTIAGHLKSGS